MIPIPIGGPYPPKYSLTVYDDQGVYTTSDHHQTLDEAIQVGEYYLRSYAAVIRYTIRDNKQNKNIRSVTRKS